MLYEKDADDAISMGFDKFAAVLGADSDDMDVCYMAEINLGMDGLARHPQRIKDAIGFFRARLDGSRYQLGTVHYTIGNAFHALRDEQEAKRAFEAALEDPALGRLPELAAQIHKNLGSSYGLLGEQEKAVDQYREALRLAPDLAEAHNALGNHYVRLGRYEDALRHFDQVVFSERKQGRTSAVTGWRANVLFNLSDGQAASRSTRRELRNGVARGRLAGLGSGERLGPCRVELLPELLVGNRRPGDGFALVETSEGGVHEFQAPLTCRPRSKSD